MRRPPVTSSELYRAARELMLNSKRPPAKTDIYGAAVILGYTVDEIGFLHRAGMLPCLGEATAGTNSRRYWLTSHLLQLSTDVAWMEKAQRCVYAAWRKKNESTQPGREKAA